MNQNLNSPQHSFIQINAFGVQQPLINFSGFADCASIPSTLTQNTVDVVMPLLMLAQSPGYLEQWSDGAAVVVDPMDEKPGLISAQTEHHLMLSFQCADLPLNDLVEDVYTKAYQLGHQLGFKHLIRVWNYIHHINHYEQGEERYQTFCVARHRVVEAMHQLDQPNPAATAIGGHHGHNTFVFLFSHHAGQVIENKRQVSAWQYPKQYAPKQPRFSRAMQCDDVLMCSGTASVVGHETIHLNDLAAQLDECLINVQALLDESTLTVPLNAGLFRFYLRDKNLLEQVVSQIQQRKIQSYIILEGDVCRENLLIECEAVFQSVQKTVKLD